MLPPLLDVSEIQKRLQDIFPEGTPQRTYCTREMAARTIFVLLYIGTVEGSAIWMGPKHIYRMGTSQAALLADSDRQDYVAAVAKPGSTPPPDRWFQDNTREPIRDETLRDGLVRVGAIVTAFQDRNHGAFRKAVPNLAWGSFAWCLSEPEHLIALDGTTPGGFGLLSDFRVFGV